MASKDLALAEKPVLQLVADLEEAGAMDAVSLTLDTKEPMPFDKWMAFGRFLGNVNRSARWWIGDWLIFGEDAFGQVAAQAVEATTAERYDEAERVTGLAHDTLLNIVRVCAGIPKGRRRPELSFSTHEPVVALEPDEQTHWLQRAIDEGWTRSELREEIRIAAGGTPRDPDGVTPDGSSGSGLTLAERVEAAARLVYHQGQPQRSGEVLVPGDAWQRLASALGEE
jgi:hypothetical protein